MHDNPAEDKTRPARARIYADGEGDAADYARAIVEAIDFLTEEITYEMRSIRDKIN